MIARPSGSPIPALGQRVGDLGKLATAMRLPPRHLRRVVPRTEWRTRGSPPQNWPGQDRGRTGAPQCQTPFDQRQGRASEPAPTRHGRAFHAGRHERTSDEARWLRAHRPVTTPPAETLDSRQIRSHVTRDYRAELAVLHRCTQPRLPRGARCSVRPIRLLSLTLLGEMNLLDRACGGLRAVATTGRFWWSN